jgi:ubiquinone/menaquinone biosynthesis C-methylase UbiE
MSTIPRLFEFNRHMYLGRRTAAAYVTYARRTGLKPAEAALLRAIGGEIKGRALLDIGVGAGRTTPHLLEWSADYTGIDFSEDMLAICRERFPQARFVACDARNMSVFGDGQFDFVLFSYNGIDCSGPEDRLRILAEIHRILRDGGLFAFCSLNRRKRTIRAHELANLRFSRNPLVMLGRLLRYPVGIINQQRWKKFEQETEEYSLRNTWDTVHAYSIILYHITLQAQISQLDRAGFDFAMAVDDKGEILSPDSTSDCPEIYYLSRKRPA